MGGGLARNKRFLLKAVFQSGNAVSIRFRIWFCDPLTRRRDFFILIRDITKHRQIDGRGGFFEGLISADQLVILNDIQIS